MKHFQRRTVEHAFRRLFLDADSTHRFLVADEVGLGKTLVARGVIAKAVEHLWDRGERIDIVYVCSNADIARQNINRLRSDPSNEFALATRATLLPIELRDMNRRVNYVSMTPGTSLEPRGGMGIARERALLYHLLREHWELPRRGGMNVLRGVVGYSSFASRVDEILERDIDERLKLGFLQELDRLEASDRVEGRPSLRDRVLALAAGEEDAATASAPGDPRRFVIADLRAVLGRTCITALRPDLVILDEFQRFKHLLDVSNEDAELAHALFEYADQKEAAREAVRVLLLSATPYRMYTQAHEAQEQGDHYEDFVATYEFLVRHEPQQSRELQQLLRDYRGALLRVEQDGVSPLARIKQSMEERLRRVMSRTERLTATTDRSGMLREVVKPVRLEATDVHHYVAAAKVAEALEHAEVVEYWKSAPYLLNFMDEYELKRSFRQAIADGDATDLMATLAEPNSGLLPWDDVVAYRRIDPANARLRALLADTVDNGMWRLLWLPPSFPYYAPSGPFAAVSHPTKRLVFSAWQVVPKVIASVVSHEAERQMMASAVAGAGLRNTPEDRKKIAALLRFSRSDKRLTGMPVLGLIYPSLALAGAFDPVAARRPGGTAASMLLEARASIDVTLAEAKSRWSRRTEPDERWYWAAPILLDLLANASDTKCFWWHPDLAKHWAGDDVGKTGAETETETSDGEGESAWAEHVRHARDLVADALRPGGLSLGAPPADLADVLAKACLANPAVAALRALGRVLGWQHSRDVEVRLAAGRVAWRLRNLFNFPEVIAMLRGWNGAEPYWLRVLEYSVDGCLQAVLDEYVHVAAEGLGVPSSGVVAAAKEIADEMARAIGLRSAMVGVDTIRMRPKASRVDIKAERMRARFAARFGQQQGDDASDRDRAGLVRSAFNSPFWPFVLASTSVGQEGLDFHWYCHAVVHWNLPSNPVDLEQREGRVHRYKGHAVRKNVVRAYGERAVPAFSDPWISTFQAAADEHAASSNEMVPFWVFPLPDGAVIERHVPTLPLSRDADKLVQLR
ncbi:MAG: DEAD/DEAH box helicase, partial [Planctomycetes bacterium]|nr:DEAD/DEAH box helicase [Planctomycetota bacterium]